MLTIDNKLIQIYGIRALASAARATDETPRRAPATPSVAPFSRLFRREPTGRKGAS
jgi:hypothetical protein